MDVLGGAPTGILLTFVAVTLVVLKLLVGLLAVVVTELGLGSLWGLGAPAD